MPKTTILIGDNLNALKKLADKSVRCVVTSPPYWGLRDYGLPPVVWGGDPTCEHEWGDWHEKHDTREETIAGKTRTTNRSYGAASRRFDGNHQKHTAGTFCQKCGAWLGALGLEPTPELYVEHLVLIFREVKRVLADDGTLWLNIGDSRAANCGYQVPDSKWCDVGNSRGMKASSFGMKPKDLVGVPWMVAFALRADGWYLRSDIIWHKPNVKPESVTDRPTSCHEYVFLLSKSARYYYDNVAVKEPSADQKGAAANFCRETKDHLLPGQSAMEHRPDRKPTKYNGTRNRRDVWSINTKGYKGAHFAVFPPALVEPCILAGTSEKGKCPTCGKPWGRVKEHIGGDTEAHVRPKRTAGMDSATSTLSLSGNGSKEWAERGGKTVTLSWQPTCTCPPHDPIPDIVLDPFGGAGTTALVASRLGRDCILVDASEVYCVNLAAPRIRDDAPLFNQVSVVNVETEDLTPTENLL